MILEKRCHPTPDALYDEGVRYAYDATHAPSLALTQRYYDKAARLFEQAAMHGHAGAMMGALTVRVGESVLKKTYETDSKEAPSARTTAAGCYCRKRDLRV